MKLKLYSDFHDFYDFMFDREGKPFVRFSEDDLTKENQFALLSAAGILTPRANQLYKLLNYNSPPNHYVIYTNPTTHRGEGKFLISREEALIKVRQDKFAGLFASEFISQRECQKSTSTRILSIGNRQFRFIYKSDDEWRSNCGNVSVTYYGELTGNSKIKSPLPGRGLWAVDLIHHEYAGTFGIDLNTSPGLKGTGIEDILSATEVLDLLREFYNKFEE